MRETKGITLISLIITIIVMLILISVTVNVLIESGIIGSAKNAANKTQTAYQNEATLDKITIGGVEYDSIQDFEQKRCVHTYGEWVVVKEATYTEAGERYRTCTKCNLKQTEYPDILACENHTYGEWVTDTEPTCVAVGKKHQTCSTCGTVTEEEIAVDTENGHNYENGTCTHCNIAEPVAGITASTIASATTKSDYYGDYVTGITLNNGDTSTQWRIFYADANNIYLIAADYIDAQAYVSKDLVDNMDSYTGTKPHTKYCAYFKKTIALEAYNGGAEETAIFGEAKVGGTLLKTYLDYLNANSSLAKNNPNMQATAFMLDTTAWSGYTDSNQATKYIDYAIGGPTIEMFRDSYNGYNGTTTMYAPIGECGYYFGTSQTTTSSATSIEKSNDLYVNDTTASVAAGYWCASPSANFTGNLCNVFYVGQVNNYNYDMQAVSFRPVVRLNTNVKLIPSGTDTYTVSY